MLTLVLGLLAHMTRMARASMIEVLERPFVRAARLRGLRPRRVILRHALRNALLPTVGIVAINVGYLIGGIFVVETVFAYPGLGRLMVDAVSHRDVPGDPDGRAARWRSRTRSPTWRPTWPTRTWIPASGTERR